MSLTDRYAWRSAVWLAIATVTTGVVCLVVLRHGVFVTPDGWAYWEGSASLLHGQGYRFFGGERIYAWPPGWPLWLAAVQALTGTNGFGLALALSLCAAGGVAVWSVTLDRLWRDSGVAVPGRLLGTALLGIGLVLWSRAVLAHSLAVLVFGIAAHLASRRPSWRHWSMALTASVVMVMVHASMLVVLPGLWLWALMRQTGSTRARMARTAWVPAAALIGLAALIGMGVIGYHAGAIETATDTPRLLQAVNALVDLVGSPGRLPRLILLAAGAVSIGVAFEDHAWRGPLALGVSSVLLLALLAAVSAVHDDLSGRFVFFEWPLLVGLLVRGTALPNGPLRFVATLLLATLVVSQGRTVATLVKNPGTGRYPDRIDWDTAIDAQQAGDPSHTVVSPPTYPWQERAHR